MTDAPEALQSVKVVCTGNGTHRKYRIATWERREDGQWWMREGIAPLAGTGNPQWQKLHRAQLGEYVALHCPRCNNGRGRSLQRKESALRDMFDTLSAAGKSMLDISLLEY